MRRLLPKMAALGAGVALVAGAAFVAARDHAPAPTTASSHREAPGLINDPQADNTDFYMWIAPDAQDSITFVANVVPFQSPYGGPNFFRFGDDVIYRINIDNDGNAMADMVFEWRFKTNVANGNTFLYNTGPITFENGSYRNLNVSQTYTLTRIDMDTGVRTVLGENLLVPPVNVGGASTANYDALVAPAIHTLQGGAKAFAGQRDDPFFADLGPIFDLLQIRPMNAVDSLAGYNVLSMVLQVPKAWIATTGSPVIGAWATTSRMSMPVAGGAAEMKQVSRLGNPLVNEVVLPLSLKDAFNSISPDVDRTVAAAVQSVTDPEVPKLLKQLFNIDSPPAPRTDLVTIFLQGIPMLNQPANVTPAEMLRLNTSIAPSANPNRMGVLGGDTAGFPNGRRLTDDVVDIALQAVAGATPFTPDFNRAPNNTLGDGVSANDKPFLSAFPYVASPNSGSEYAGPARISR
jgi:hypothetical protein